MTSLVSCWRRTIRPTVSKTRQSSGINSLIHSVSLASHVSTHLLIHLSAHLYHHHYTHHPSFLHSFTPGTKPTFSTDHSHLNTSSILHSACHHHHHHHHYHHLNFLVLVSRENCLALVPTVLFLFSCLERTVLTVLLSCLLSCFHVSRPRRFQNSVGCSWSCIRDSHYSNGSDNSHVVVLAFDAYCDRQCPDVM